MRIMIKEYEEARKTMNEIGDSCKRTRKEKRVTRQDMRTPRRHGAFLLLPNRIGMHVDGVNVAWIGSAIK